MLNFKRTGIVTVTALMLTVSAFIFIFSGCSKEPAWKAVNDKVIEEHNVAQRFRDDIPDT